MHPLFLSPISVPIPRPSSSSICHIRVPYACQPAPSALDSIPPQVKLNAVATALAQKGDHLAAVNILREMSTSNISADLPSLCAMLDATLSFPSSFADMLSLGAPTRFGSWIVQDGESGLDLTAVDPKRTMELCMGGLFLSVVGGAVGVEVVEPVIWHHSADEATTVLVLVLTGLVWDRWGGGGGKIWERLVGGVGRLMGGGEERRVRVEAGWFVVGYLVGIGWLGYKPELRQITKLNDVDIKFLVWMMAGVAVEMEWDGRLIECGWREGRQLADKYGWGEKHVAWAVMEARQILKVHRAMYEGVVRVMTEGGTVGECIQVIADDIR